MPFPCTSLKNRGLVPKTETLKPSQETHHRTETKADSPFAAKEPKEVSHVGMERRAIVYDDAGAACKPVEHIRPHHPACLCASVRPAHLSNEWEFTVVYWKYVSFSVSPK